MKKILLLFSSFLTTTILTNNVVSCIFFHKNRPKHDYYKDMTTVPSNYSFELGKKYEFKVDGEKCKFENGSTTESEVIYETNLSGRRYFEFPSDNSVKFHSREYSYLWWNYNDGEKAWQLDSFSCSSCGTDISKGEIWILMSSAS